MAVAAAEQPTLRNAAALLTNSRMAAYKTCQRKHQLRYELGLRADSEVKPLRFGRAFHLGLDLNAIGQEFQLPIRQGYAETIRASTYPEDELELQYEMETCLTLLRGYVWRWGNSIKIVHSEFQYSLPITNPDTGFPTPSFTQGGKIDKIIELENGHLAVMEHKTTGFDLAPDSDYWRRLRIDQQVSHYMIGARGAGHDVQSVLYDVIRKPTIRPSQVPLLDENGLKIVRDNSTSLRVSNKTGGFRQSAGEGMTLESRPMTPDEWVAKLEADIQERPDFYFARMEIARTESELDEYRLELWQIQKQMRENQRLGRWFRNTNACIAFSKCEFFNICANGGLPADGTIPAGFVRGEIHEELE